MAKHRAIKLTAYSDWANFVPTGAPVILTGLPGGPLDPTQIEPHEADQLADRLAAELPRHPRLEVGGGVWTRVDGRWCLQLSVRPRPRIDPPRQPTQGVVVLSAEVGRGAYSSFGSHQVDSIVAKAGSLVRRLAEAGHPARAVEWRAQNEAFGEGDHRAAHPQMYQPLAYVFVAQGHYAIRYYPKNHGSWALFVGRDGSVESPLPSRDGWY